MTVQLTEEQVAALESVKTIGKELESQVVNSLAVQNVGGYHLRNLAIKMNAAMQVVSPDTPVVPEDEEPSIEHTIQPNE